MRLIPNRWSEFQHYKDRAPPWIRLHRKLLDNKDFHRLPVESRALAPMLWLLASESVDGVIEATFDDLAFRLRSDERSIEQAIRPLVERGFFTLDLDASEALATRSPETEAETEAEKRQRTEAETDPESEPVAGAAARRPPRRQAAGDKPESVTAPVWHAYADAYQRRYSVEPVRNAKVNGQLAQFVGRVPQDEAPRIAAFYVGHSSRFYSEKGHAVDFLLRDAEKLRTEWATGRQIQQPAGDAQLETPYARQMRERAQVLGPGVAAKPPTAVQPLTVIENDGSQKLIA